MSQAPKFSVSDQILDNLEMVESGGNPKAINPQSKAMGAYQFMPGTVEMMRRKGIEFDPFNRDQSREVARNYINDLLRINNGDIKKSLAQYGGFITKDPSAYVNKVMKGVQQPLGKPMQIAAAEPSDELGALILGEKPSNKSAAEPSDELGSLILGEQPIKPRIESTAGAGRGSYAGFNAKEANVPVQPAPVIAPSKPYKQAVDEEDSKLKGAGEAALAAGSALLAYPAGAAAGIYGTLKSGKYGTPEGIQEGEKVASDVIESLTYQPKTKSGQEYTQALQQAFEASKIPPVMIGPEGLPIGKGGKPSAAQAPVKPVQAPMGSVGAAGASKASTLAAAIEQARSPELKADFAAINPEDLNIQAVNRHLEADSLPIPVPLTKGQALQDANLISRERNERGFKEQYAQRFNEQNKALQENAQLIKEQVSPNINTTDYVADATNAIDFVNEIKKDNVKKTQDAYAALQEANGGKFPVDAKSFADNAMNKLLENDEIEFLPSAIKSRVESYASGTKEMNFNQFENLRTIIARETRKAQRAEDGNAVHALSLVRQSLEDLPMPGASAEIKALADNARSLAKADFDLERNNPLYNKVINEAADSKDFIQNFVIRSKNQDFAKSLDLLKDNPTALEHLKSGVLDYITRDSTDASGNFLTGKFTKHINNLDVNKKLDALFGEDANLLRNMAKTGQYIEARPKGSYVNESNTATAAAALAKQYGAKLAGRIPVVGALVEPAQEVLQKRKAAKEIKETLKPGAGSRLSDIGK